MGEIDQLRRELLALEDRIAPVIQADHLGQQLSAQPVGDAVNQIDT